MSSQRAVKIRNPLGGAGWTSAKRALKYLKRGQCRLVGENEIEFIQSDFRAQSAERTMTTTLIEPAGAPPSHGPALLVVPEYGDWSHITFAPYPYRWEGYRKAA